MHYVTFWKGLKTVAGLEKLASSSDPVQSQQAQVLLSRACDETFSALKSASAQVLPSLMQMRDAHRTTGEKLAASPEVTAELLHKLAVAVFVDDHLDTQLVKLSGGEYESTRAVQRLGREYAVKLMRGLFA